MRRAYLREWLEGHLWTTVEWREKKATEHPGDPRNQRSADALTAAARWVGQINLKEPLPVGFERLLKLADEISFTDDWGEESARVASRFFFDKKTGKPTPDDFDSLLMALEPAIRAAAEADQAEFVTDYLRRGQDPQKYGYKIPSELLGLITLGLDARDEQKGLEDEEGSEGLDEVLVARLDEVRVSQRLDAIDEKLDRVLDLLS